MNLVDMRRKNTRFSIAQNPTVITIERTEKKRINGYLDEDVYKLEPQTVRLYSTNAGSPQEIVSLAGEKQTDRRYEMLADYRANVQASSDVKDEFIADGIKYVIKAVWPQSIHGEIVGYQCELERVM